MITVVSWNIGRRLQSVEELLAMEADVSLLQEVGPGALEALKETGGNVAVSPQDPWGPWPRATLRPLAHGGEAVRPGQSRMVQADPAHRSRGAGRRNRGEQRRDYRRRQGDPAGSDSIFLPVRPITSTPIGPLTASCPTFRCSSPIPTPTNTESSPSET